MRPATLLALSEVNVNAIFSLLLSFIFYRSTGDETKFTAELEVEWYASADMACWAWLLEKHTAANFCPEIVTKQYTLCTILFSIPLAWSLRNGGEHCPLSHKAAIEC